MWNPLSSEFFLVEIFSPFCEKYFQKRIFLIQFGSSRPLPKTKRSQVNPPGEANIL
jgi:hypothetical protein